MAKKQVCKKSKELTTKELKTIVEFRSRSLDILLNLNDVYTQKAKWLSANPTKDPAGATGYLLGAAFSLWRAAPLIYTAGNYKEIDAGAMKLLSYLIEDNAVAYQQEKATRDWTAGYYLNSGLLRLKRISDLLKSAESDHIEEILNSKNKDYPKTWTKAADWLEGFIGEIRAKLKISAWKRVVGPRVNRAG